MSRHRPAANAKPAVAILDAQSPTGLAFTRSLGRAGVPIRVYAQQRFPVARLSRYCSHFATCPNPEDADVFLPWLRDEVARGDIGLVAPTSDLMAFYMGEYPECFPAAQVAAMPTPAAIRQALLKDRFDAACREHRLQGPLTHFPTSEAEAAALAERLPYPVILKPKSHVGVGLARGLVVHNPSELRAQFRPYPIRPSCADIIARYPELVWPMIQEYVPGALAHLYSISGLLGADGTVLAWAGSRKTLQWPPTLGVGVVFESWQAREPIERGLRFAQQVLGRGIFELELIYDPRVQDYVAIDLNPRAHGHISFDMARHNDLPLWWYQLACGETVTPQPRAANDVRWLHGIPFHVGQWIGLLRGPGRGGRLQQYVRSMRGETVDIIHDRHDPLPTVAHAAYMLRHPGGLIRPLWREHT